MKPNIYVTRRLPQVAMDLLEKNFQIESNPYDRVLTRAELLEKVKGRDGLLPLLTDRIDGEVMEAAGRQLRVIANYAVGFNNIDVPAATARKIAVTNTPGVLTDTTADLTLALILGVARRLAESDRYARAGKYEGWAPLLFLGADVHHKTLGLMGFGRIGYAVAKRALGFDMRILYHDNRRADPELERQVQAQYAGPGYAASGSGLPLHPRPPHPGNKTLPEHPGVLPDEAHRLYRQHGPGRGHR